MTLLVENQVTLLTHFSCFCSSPLFSSGQSSHSLVPLVPWTRCCRCSWLGRSRSVPRASAPTRPWPARSVGNPRGAGRSCVPHGCTPGETLLLTIHGHARGSQGGGQFFQDGGHFWGFIALHLNTTLKKSQNCILNARRSL